MLHFESLVTERYPGWFTTGRSAVTRPLLRWAARFGRFDQAEAFLHTSRHLAGLAFVEAALDHLDVRYSIDQVERERIPHTGRLLVVANHPAGAHDALSLLHLIGSIRRDVRIVANDMLDKLDGLRPLLLPVRVLGGAASANSISAIEQALEDGQCVIVFPAGEVSRLGWNGITDSRWRRGFLRFARRTGAPVLPVKIAARNSAFFYLAAAMCKPLGTLLLPREVFTRRGARIELRVGRPLAIGASGSTTQALAEVRDSLYALGTVREVAGQGTDAIIPAVDRAALLVALKTLSLLGVTPDGKQIFAGRLDADSPLLSELGRLRELSFRAVGEGTGKRMDLDAYDTWYEHIVLWDPHALQVAGAYRAALGARVHAAYGLDGFYTASLFDYHASLVPRLLQGVELGRSFVAPDYWNTRSLDYLWLGIGAYLRRHPQVRYLFGAVTASATLPANAREQLVSHYQHFFGATPGAAQARRPFVVPGSAPCYAGLDANEGFRLLKANLGALGARVPTLYKQYTELCEPGGARFLAFGIDARFNDAVDGLIEVDLQRVQARKRERYLQAPTPAMRTTPAAESA